MLKSKIKYCPSCSKTLKKFNAFFFLSSINLDMLPGAVLVLGEEATDKALPPLLRGHQVSADEIFQVGQLHCTSIPVRY